MICSGRMTHSMADIAQLVRALVCGTKCRRFESGYPPHYKKTSQRGVFFIMPGRYGREPPVRAAATAQAKGAHGV